MKRSSKLCCSGPSRYKIECPPDEEFKQTVGTKSMKNCPITVNDIADANSILGLRNHGRLKEGSNKTQSKQEGWGLELGLKYPETSTS